MDVTPVMIKTEVPDPELAEIGWQYFNLPWHTGYLTNTYIQGLDIVIHKEPDDFRLHRLRPILLFNIDANMYNKHS